MRLRSMVVAWLVFSLVVSAPALAQQRHVVNPADMRQAITDHARAQEHTRETLRGVLKNAQVREVAQRMGLDVARAERSVATLTGADLERLAGPARDAQRELVGGSNTVVISTTTLLLLIIIVILLAK